MNALVRTIVESAGLLVVGTTIAFAGNTFRNKNSIELSRNYFEIKPVAVPDKMARVSENVQPITESPVIPAVPSAGVPATVYADVRTAEPEIEKHLEHDYQPIAFAEVKAAFSDPRREQGLIVFVDARADEPFASGHIPGALQCDHYNLNQYIGPVLAKARVAEQVIVYCNGGQCEDSILMCQNLLENGLDYNAVFLYEGGWKEWEKSGMPIATGDAP